MRSHWWLTILAGGEGRRLASVTRDSDGRYVPKQFWDFAGEGSSFAHAIARARSLVPANRVIVLVQEAHRRWWEPDLAQAGGVHVISQPSNRGTGVALLEALRLALRRDRDPRLVAVPSDQEVDDESVWHDALRRAAEASQDWPDHLLLLTVEAQMDRDFGWVLTGRETDDGTRPVTGFYEKPDDATAAQLAIRGALCSTFAFAVAGRALLDLFHRHARPIFDAYRAATLDPHLAIGRLRTALALPIACDFSREVLERALESLRVLPVPACGWTDLGTPERVSRWRSHRRREAATAVIAPVNPRSHHAVR